MTQEKLSDLKVDKAYRFKHWEAFCFFSQNITITLTGNMVNLHYIEYSTSPEGKSITLFRPNGDTLKINPYCTVVKEFNKVISLKDWENLEMKVRDGDYWGMTSKGDAGVRDGSIWQIDAFTGKKFHSQTIRRSHSVWRHSLFSNEFKDLGRYMLSLSGEKTMCGELN